MELQGQVAIVTGAGRGIGRATALELARMGADIVVAELDRGNADKTAAAVHRPGRRAIVDPDRRHQARRSRPRMVERTQAELGRIDILVNNAGIYRAASTLDVTEDHWDAIMTINAKAVFFASQAVLPTMIAPSAATSSTWPRWPARSAARPTCPTTPARPRSSA